jgi:hypothetical protein
LGLLLSSAVQYITHSPVGARTTFGSCENAAQTSSVPVDLLAPVDPLDPLDPLECLEFEAGFELEFDWLNDRLKTTPSAEVAWMTWLFVVQESMPQCSSISLAHI